MWQNIKSDYMSDKLLHKVEEKTWRDVNVATVHTLLSLSTMYISYTYYRITYKYWVPIFSVHNIFSFLNSFIGNIW